MVLCPWKTIFIVSEKKNANITFLYKKLKIPMFDFFIVTHRHMSIFEDQHSAKNSLLIVFFVFLHLLDR